MSSIEVLLLLLLLFMSVPDLCRLLRRPTLAYAVFVLFGVGLNLLGEIVSPQVHTLLQEAGKIGFMLVLFEVGLEVDMPRLRDFLKPLKFVAPWVLVQYPVIFGLAYFARLTFAESLVAASALSGCSVSMAYGAWKHYPGMTPDVRTASLRILVTLEILAIVLLAMESELLRAGLSWKMALTLLGILVTIYLVGRFAVHLTQLFQRILSGTTYWRTHLLVLMVLLIGAIGERLGLSAPKTAFFLGLFMSRVEHEGRGLEEFIAPVSRRFLIPIFFVSLGMIVEWEMLKTWSAPLALGTALALLLMRRVMQAIWPKLPLDGRGFLLLCPNLTVVALGVAAVLAQPQKRTEQAGWLLLTGLSITVISIFLLPAAQPGPEEPATNPSLNLDSSSAST